MKKDIVSIITTFYNAEQFIIHTLASVYSQIVDKDKFEIEYVLVDDHSPDNSRKLVEAFM